MTKLSSLVEPDEKPRPQARKPSSRGGRRVLYILVIMAAGGAAAYFLWSGRSAPSPATEEAKARADAIQATAPGQPTQAPDLPVEGRPPRGKAFKLK